MTTTSSSMRDFSRLQYRPSQLMDNHSHWKTAWKLTSIISLKLSDTWNDATPLALFGRWIHSPYLRDPPRMLKQWRLRVRTLCLLPKPIRRGPKNQTPGHRSVSSPNLSRHLGHPVDVVVLCDSDSFLIQATIQILAIRIRKKMPVQIKTPVEIRNRKRVHTRKR